LDWAPTEMAKLGWGLVGGGEGSFFGPVHRMAAALDGRFELAAGAFSSDPANNRRSGHALGLAAGRIYDSFAEMARAEAARLDLVTIATPNHLHFAAAKAFLEAGIAVLCEKPMTLDLAEAEALRDLVARSGRPFVLAHTYTGYPMVRRARDLAASGALGTIHVVQVEYAQDWLAGAAFSKQAAWRIDPARSGAGGGLGDIGTHAFNLAVYVTGLTPRALCADIDHFGEGRVLDDNAHCLLRFDGGAKGMLWCSQVAIGRKNALTLRVYGSEGGLEWSQEDPERLTLSQLGGPTTILQKTDGRLPVGHPEGFIEALGQLYRDLAQVLTGGSPAAPLPGAEDGVAGLRFVEAAVRSAGGWVDL